MSLPINLFGASPVGMQSGAITFEVPANSYNELFGKGNHGSADPALEACWELQDDAASTTIVDSSGNGRDSVLQGGSNTSDLSGVGPNAWLPKAIDFDGTDDYVTGAAAANTNYPFSICLWYNSDQDANFAALWSSSDPGQPFEQDVLSFRGFSSSPYMSATTRDASGTAPVASSQIGDAGTWRHVAAVFDTSDRKISVGAETFVTATWGRGQPTPRVDEIGRLGDSTPGNHFDGRIAGVAKFSRKIVQTERDEIYQGPEPYFSSQPPAPSGSAAVGAPLTADVSTIVDPNNGAISYTYQWFTSVTEGGAITNIAGATSSTYTVQAAEDGLYIGVMITPSNLGGIDPLELNRQSLRKLVAAGDTAPDHHPTANDHRGCDRWCGVD